MVLDYYGNLSITGTYSPPSDRAVKQDLAAVDSQAVLEKLAALSLQTWSYTNSPSVRHLGPMGQDFHAAFGLGADDKHIATVDADGVALASIQGLNQKLEEKLKAKDLRISTLERRVANLEKLLNALVNTADQSP